MIALKAFYQGLDIAGDVLCMHPFDRLLVARQIGVFLVLFFNVL